MDSLNYFDIIVLSLSAILGLKGLFRGLVKELFSLLGIVGGVFLSSRIAPNISSYIDNIIQLDNEQLLQLISFIVAFILFWLAFYIIGNLVSKILSLSGLGVFDRFLGFVFGGAKIFLLFSIIFYAASNIKVLNQKIDKWTKNSITYPILLETGAYIIKLDTNNIKEKIENNIDTIKKNLVDR